MKKLVTILVSCFLLFYLGNMAQATLINLGNDVTYDDTSGLYWYNNLRSTYYTNYDEAKAFYEGTTRTVQVGDIFITFDNFNMATKDEYLSLMSNNRNDIVDTFTESNVEPDEMYYVGRFDEEIPGSVPRHSFGGFFGIFHYDQQIGDWIEFETTITSDVRGISPLASCAWGVAAVTTPVPEPATMFLFGTGLTGLVGSRIKKKRK